ncbi:MAG: hypothetical protein GC205_06745 [Bacteroidetes bacterium]|nr:hypothetical protein [Bacteroidota bacterium]
MSTVETFIQSYSPGVQEVFHYLRNLAQELLPDAEEILYEGWKNVSYGTGESRSDKDLILYIAPFKDSVNLGFFRGTLLPDEKQRLKGTGKLLRHVKLKRVNELPEAEIRELIVAARKERLGK